MSQKFDCYFRGQETLKHKIEIIFQLPIVDDEYKVEQKLEGEKKDYENRDGRNQQTLAGSCTLIGKKQFDNANLV